MILNIFTGVVRRVVEVTSVVEVEVAGVFVLLPSLLSSSLFVVV